MSLNFLASSISEFNEKFNKYIENSDIPVEKLSELMSCGEKILLLCKYESEFFPPANQSGSFSINHFLETIIQLYKKTNNNEVLEYFLRVLYLLSDHDFFENLSIIEHANISREYVSRIFLIFKYKLELNSNPFILCDILRSFSCLLKLEKSNNSLINEISKHIINMLPTELKINCKNSTQLCDALKKNFDYFESKLMKRISPEPNETNLEADEDIVYSESSGVIAYQTLQRNTLLKYVESYYLSPPIKRSSIASDTNPEFYDEILYHDQNSHSSLDDSMKRNLNSEEQPNEQDSLIIEPGANQASAHRSRDLIFELTPLQDDENVMTENLEKSHRTISHNDDQKPIMGLDSENLIVNKSKLSLKKKKKVVKRTKRYYTE